METGGSGTLELENESLEKKESLADKFSELYSIHE